MIVKPANSQTPIIVNDAGEISNSTREIVSIYIVGDGGAAQVKVHDGSGNGGVVLAVTAANATAGWTPAQPAKFGRVIVDFVSGNAIVTIQFN